MLKLGQKYYGACNIGRIVVLQNSLGEMDHAAITNETLKQIRRLQVVQCIDSPIPQEETFVLGQDECSVRLIADDSDFVVRMHQF